MVQESVKLYGLTREEFLQNIALDTTSPSGLRWIKTLSSTAVKGSVCGSYSRAVKFPCWRMKLNKKAMIVARVLWLLITGTYPKGVVDHRNGNTYDHNPKNLRCVGLKTNCENRVLQNKNGIAGVYLTEDSRGNPIWRVQGVTKSGVRWSRVFAVKKHGHDRARELAIACRKQKEIENSTQTREVTLGNDT